MAVSRISPLASSSVQASTGPPTFSPISPPPKHRSNMMRFLTRKYLIAGALSVSTVGSLVMGLTITSTPAQAQITVFDPGNYSQNLLTAARTLQRSEEHTSELQSLMRISYGVLCLQKKKNIYT